MTVHRMPARFERLVADAVATLPAEALEDLAVILETLVGGTDGERARIKTAALRARDRLTETALTEEDRALLDALMDERDHARCATAIWAYYHDLDRAERTPRSYLYVHLGMLTAAVLASTRPTEEP